MDEEYVEKEPLFPSPRSSVFEGEEGSAPPTLNPPTRRKRHNLMTNVLFIAYIPLLVLYVLLAFQFIRSKPFGQTVDLDLFPSLARSWPVQTERKVYKLRVVDSNFTGKPEPVIDHAWHNLLEGVTFRVSKEDLDFYNVTSIPLADGSGYATETFMTHELHCLVAFSLPTLMHPLLINRQKLIRKWKYKEFYYARELEGQGPALAELDRHVGEGEASRSADLEADFEV